MAVVEKLNISITLSYYKQLEIQKAIVLSAQDREFSALYGLGNFGKSADTIRYPADVMELAKQKATSFHCSEERWSNPLQLDTSMKRRDLDALRIGWDLVLDIDCQQFEYSRIAADIIIRFLKYTGIKSISCKFSGNKGFHIGVPYEAFPKTIEGVETRLLFPEAPKKIAAYIKSQNEIVT